MRWIEAVVETRPEEIDALCLKLSDVGVDGMVIEDEQDFQDFLEHNHQYWDYVDEELEQRFAGASRIKFYLADDAGGAQVLSRIRTELNLAPAVSYIEDSDWENNWKEFYRPMEIGERLLVVPQWEAADAPDKTVLRLDPGLIFGTGSHATTRMCLCAVECLAAPGVRCLDLGCGSGILGIAACLCGCGGVVGCDIDPKAPDVAEANAALNGLGRDRFRVYAGDVLSDAGLRARLGAGYGLVLANIVADVIIPLAGLVREFMAPGAVFVCSGIIEGRQDEVRAALEKNGLTILDHDCQEEWHCYIAHICG
jgi:ribosomal protein L11 methyltransferase